MDIDFPLILVVLTFATGLIYLADAILWKPKRDAAKDNSSSAASEEEISEGPWLVEVSRSFFPVLAIVLVLRSFLVEPFQIPSGSMLPSLEVGDFILVNKYAYGFRLPVVGTKVIEMDDPQRGDVMVFKYPKDGKTNYIKRVIGVPGDKIEYKDKQLWINGELVEEKLLANLPGRKLFEETLGSVKHKLYEHKAQLNRGAEGYWEIPEGSYFMVGDNRDNSNDSRFWGVVPDHLVVGKAFAIWMHWPKFFSIPSFSRVGAIE
ncbi:MULTISPECIES: signal peptidase I [unclassified Oleiphilus]|jgi:signal peptidase I|nr:MULTISPECIES: signal peptidase I [unclassified Oleiphilus]KZY45003.1 S26 family signal peptidase [Oleiphilus sp. HI0050]KZY86310.1 S26 family signal peptidase [Oleiphilus sp. HI0069]KZZ07354.1 S26 family signal peptidase [Oleiphilus sp. HI0078]KZZ21406.1 S26 family signal peptidase [Oleiphilus sp. HI0081]KZZ33866.1 S26 family signal peptidase [Oleiphilus sp. HI0085]